MKLVRVTLAAIAAALTMPAPAETPTGSAFTYQGRLNTSGTPASGAHDFEFSLYDDPTSGIQVGPTVSLTANVTAGLFTAPLDFGATAWTENKRWLEVHVRTNGETTFTSLFPRTEITPAPHALLPETVARRNTAQTFTADQAITGNVSITDGNVVATGTFFQTAAPPVTGVGTRMMWLPGKGSFRAGHAEFDEWDPANVGNYSTALGLGPKASGDYSSALGYRAKAEGRGSSAMGYLSTASGDYATAIGYRCIADGDYSVALGQRADTDFRAGCFVFADAASVTPLLSSAYNQFLVRASGGIRFYSNSTQTAGVQLSAGSGTWSNLSDRNTKNNITAVNPRAILEGVLKLPIATWNYKSQEEKFRHIGPMAQDFFAAFKVGEDDKHISSVDPDGVALAAIQGLHAELVERDEKLADQQKQISDLKAQVTELETLKETVAKQQIAIEAIQALLAKSGGQ